MKNFISLSNKKLLLMFFLGTVLGSFIVLITFLKGYFIERSSSNLLQSSYSEIVEKVMPAVVNIYSERISSSRFSSKKSNKSLYSIFGITEPRLEKSLGSGVIFSKDGYILTNLHVIGESNLSITVELSDGATKEAKVIGVDIGTDLAVLKIETDQNLPTLKIGDSDKIKIGDIALAIGNPYGVGQSVSLGIISATGREFNNPYSNYIQTDAAINKGNSGGALIDSKGRLIGINTLIRSTSGGSEGVGLAIPSTTTLEIFSDLVQFGEVRRGWLGFNIDPGSLRSRGLLEVDFIYPDSPAERGDLRIGDLILKINDLESSYEDLFREFVRSKPGSQIKLSIERSGEIKELIFLAENSPK